MPSGACRALVSSLFSLAVVATALGAAALPAAAATEALKEDAISTYVVRPDGGAIEVKIILNLRNDGSDDGPRTWRPIYIEDGVNEAEIQFQPRGVQRVGELSDLPGPWSSMQIRIPQLGPGDERQVSITYPLEAGDLLNTETPARLGDAYVYFCMTGQPADSGVIIARLPSRYDAVTSGSPMTDEEFGLTTDEVDDPGDLFACVEGTVARNLDGRLEMFAVGWDNRVYHQWQWGNGSWSGWADRGGSIQGLPIVARNLDGRLEVFGRGTDNAIWHMWQVAPNSGWSGWASFGGGLKSEPAVGQNLDGRLQVFAVVNLPAKRVASLDSEVLVLSVDDGRGDRVLAIPERPVPDGGKLER